MRNSREQIEIFKPIEMSKLQIYANCKSRVMPTATNRFRQQTTQTAEA